MRLTHDQAVEIGIGGESFVAEQLLIRFNLDPDDWRDYLRRSAADLPHVAALGALIDRQLDDYRAEVYSPNRLGSTGQIATCICRSLTSQFS